MAHLRQRRRIGGPVSMDNMDSSVKNKNNAGEEDSEAEDDKEAACGLIRGCRHMVLTPDSSTPVWKYGGVPLQK